MAAWKGIPGNIFYLSGLYEICHSPVWNTRRPSWNNVTYHLEMLGDYEQTYLNSRQVLAKRMITVPAILLHFSFYQRLLQEVLFKIKCILRTENSGRGKLIRWCWIL